MHVDIESQLGVLVAFGDQTVNLTEVAEAGHAHHAGTLVEQSVELVHVHVGVADQVEDDGRIDIAGTATHHEPSSGVRPMESRPACRKLRTEAEAPLPICSTICLRPSAGLPMTLGTTEEMNSWEVPWAP